MSGQVRTPESHVRARFATVADEDVLAVLLDYSTRLGKWGMYEDRQLIESLATGLVAAQDALRDAMQELRERPDSALVSDLAAFVLRAADFEPIASDDVVSWCLYCDGQTPDRWEFASDTNPLEHEPDCMWVAAQALAARIRAAGLSGDSGHAAVSDAEAGE